MNYALGRNEDPQLRMALARDKRIRDRLAKLEAGLLEDRLQNQATALRWKLWGRKRQRPKAPRKKAVSDAEAFLLLENAGLNATRHVEILNRPPPQETGGAPFDGAQHLTFHVGFAPTPGSGPHSKGL